jgi:RNA polymerase II-associated factor 1
MRPMESDGDHFLTYYLTKDDDAAEQFKDSRADPRGVDALQEEEDVRFSIYLFFSFFSY